VPFPRAISAILTMIGEADAGFRSLTKNSDTTTPAGRMQSTYALAQREGGVGQYHQRPPAGKSLLRR
jgi:hypothetical protein